MLPDEVAPQPELVGVNSVVVEEYDPARPNDYKDYTREKKRKAMEAERLRDIERRREEEEEEREREKDRDKDRTMAKMGWKEGQGLGKQEQGITTPLMAKKTDRRARVIVNASKKKEKSVNFNGTPPTWVLLLRQQLI
ncbi:hypothetical protein NC652_020535 [Populus alba x Populus x berolinensis]|nr:hypothetical protein NC652_020535 [Populus alba x Populus x berolinensis]